MDDREPAGSPEAVDALLRDLAVWSADERAREAASSRSRQRWLRQQAAEAATFLGTALDLAERAALVAVRTVSGRVHHGAIVAVGTDFLAVRSDPSTVVLVPVVSITSLRAGAGTQLRSEPSGDRAPPRAVTFGQALAALAATRPAVRVVAGGGHDVVAGELRAVGEDVVTVHVDGRPGALVYVRLGSVDECTLFGSG